MQTIVGLAWQILVTNYGRNVGLFISSVQKVLNHSWVLLGRNVTFIYLFPRKINTLEPLLFKNVWQYISFAVHGL